MSFTFNIKNKYRSKRQGVIKTLHGEIKTPAFLPDATYGAVKSLSYKDVSECGIEQILCTTLHMHLKPGDKHVKRMGGLHKFMGWHGPILTDSGGWQVFSLIHQTGKGSVTEAGAEFVMPESNQKAKLTPEDSINIQSNLRSDIIVVLDDPIIGSSSKKDNERAVEITVNWAKRAKSEFYKRYQLDDEKFGKPDKYKRPLIFCVVQGGDYKDLRKKCAESLVGIGFDGFGYGGILEKGNSKTKEMLKYFSDIIPEDKVRYGMGVGRIEDIRYCINHGYDLFDSVVPTRNARHGVCYTSFGAINIKSGKYKYDNKPIDKKCDCLACSYEGKYPRASRAYLYHLFKMKELGVFRLCSIHNLRFYSKMISSF